MRRLVVVTILVCQAAACDAGGQIVGELGQGADSLVVLHTNGTVPTDPQFEYTEQLLPSLSTGVRGSTTRATWLSFLVQGGGIAGLRIDWISPACGRGQAAITAAGADSLSFAAPGEESGAAVEIAEGESKVLTSGGGDPSKYVTVTRTGASDLAGNAQLVLRRPFNGVLAGSNLGKYEVDGPVTGELFALGGTSWAVGEDAVWFLHADCDLPEGELYGRRLEITGGCDCGPCTNDGYVGWFWHDVEDSESGVEHLVHIEGITPDPPALEACDFTAHMQSGRLHCIMFHNQSDFWWLDDLTIWQPLLGTEQIIEWAYPDNGLPASGAGTIQVPDTGDWHPNVRFLRIMAAGGVTEKEVVGGHLTSGPGGHVFHVPTYGRGIHGTTPQAGEAGDIVQPVSGLAIGIDILGPKVFPSIIQGGSAPPTAAYLGGIDLDDHYIERVYQDKDGVARLPEVESWNRGTADWEGLSVPLLEAGYRIALWLYVPAFAEERFCPVTPVGLTWCFYPDAGTSGRVEHTGWTNYRILNFLDAERYGVYRSTGEGVPVDRANPVAVSSSRPIANVPLVDDAVNNLEVYRKNDYGLEGLVGETTIVLASGSVVDPLSAPQGVAVDQTGGDEITVSGFYYRAMDRSPADTWEVHVTTNGGEPEINQELVIIGEVAELCLVLSEDAWVAGAVLEVQVRVKRSSDGEVSDWVTRSVTVEDLTLAAPAGAGVFHDQRELLED